MNLSIILSQKKGKFARDIFEQHGFDVDILGNQRIKSASRRWKDAYSENGISGLHDTRVGNSGFPRERELSLEEKNARLEA